MQAVLDQYTNKDSRIRVKILDQNLGIAGNTNAALEMIQGEYAGILDHDDLLAPNALYEIARYLENDPEADGVYTDEDKVTTELDEHFQPHLKPDFNLDLLRSNNYICHFFVVRQSIIRKVGGFRQEFDGAQDHDFIFRCVEEAGRIGHVPEILYHWRTHKASTADNPASKMYAFEAGRRAIEAHLERMGQKGTVTHTPDLGFFRVQYPVQGSPMVSIIIPNKDEKESLEACLHSIKEKTAYQNYEILIIENNSVSEEIFAYYKEIEKDPKIRVLRWEREFNYSAINNFGVQHANGDYLLFLNNDVTVITPDWIEEMLGTEVSTKASLCDGVISKFHTHLCSCYGVTSVSDVCEWSAMYDCRNVFQCLNEVWFQCIFQKCCHSTFCVKVTCCYRFLLRNFTIGVTNDDLGKSFFQV